jgi:predicted pyridoxine 5'-phosphate oxidase superfamily flavin-nucleotide-binding protein
MEFRDVVHSEAELRELMGDPVAPPVVEKTLAFLDQHCRAFIGRSPFVLISSSDNKGRMDISPKGDPSREPAVRHLLEPVSVTSGRVDFSDPRQA